MADAGKPAYEIMEVLNRLEKLKSQKTHDPKKINRLLKQVDELKKKYHLN